LYTYSQTAVIKETFPLLYAAPLNMLLFIYDGPICNSLHAKKFIIQPVWEKTYMLCVISHA